MPSHVLEEGESLASLAKQYGFGTWQAIFNAGENSNLRTKRAHPNALRVGDTLFIPEKKAKVLTLAPDKKHKIVIAVCRGVWNLKWSVAKASCGDKVKLSGETNLPNGDLKLLLKSREVESPKLSHVTAQVKDNKFTFDWTIKDVQHMHHGAASKAFPEVHVDATTADANVPCNVASLAVEAVTDAAAQPFDADRKWNGFSNHSHFEQRIEKFVNVVDVKLQMLKGWGGTHVDLTAAGITGTAGGCPWAGHRWARPKGMSMVPAEYYDGKAWVPLPKGFVPSATNYQAVGFYKSAATFVSVAGGSWPEAFADYDLNSAAYRGVRSRWSARTHTQWTDVFKIRRKGCTSDKAVTCCRYGLSLNLAFVEVAAFGRDVVLLAPGALRSNAGLWFMGDTSNMPAHETGHHVDNPDEYDGGATDKTLSGDGAVAGIDSDCIMGQSMTKTKKRHYHAFVEMTAKLVNGKSGKHDTFDTVEK